MGQRGAPKNRCCSGGAGGLILRWECSPLLSPIREAMEPLCQGGGTALRAVDPGGLALIPTLRGVCGHGQAGRTAAVAASPAHLSPGMAQGWWPAGRQGTATCMGPERLAEQLSLRRRGRRPLGSVNYSNIGKCVEQRMPAGPGMLGVMSDVVLPAWLSRQRGWAGLCGHVWP